MTVMTLETHWTTLIREDMTRLEGKMQEAARMGDATLDAAIAAIIQAGGKRMRPAITLLVGRHFNALSDDVIAVAAAVELLHTATLVHDDLIDGAMERRGVATLHSRMPTGVTVLTGDFIFAKSAALAAEANNLRVVQLFADTLVTICKGEILQAQTRWQVPSRDVYIERIYGKTAALFEAAATSAAILGDSSEQEIKDMARFGRDLGLAFQIMDDALDFVSTTRQLGKPAGNDMRQGIFNLPVMFYAHAYAISGAEIIRRVENAPDALLRDIQQAGMVEKSLDVAQDYADQALRLLEPLGNNEHMAALREITRYAVARQY